MALATWWSPDPLPDLPALPGFQVALVGDDPAANRALARLNRLPVAEVRARRASGHRPYLGLLDGQPVAYGWVATEEASIGELSVTIRLPRGNRYLWDFATLPDFQGHGIYPLLLQAILRQESRDAERFWIIFAPENLPSGAGMEHAGLAPVGSLSFREDGGVGLASLGSYERAQAGAELLGVPLVETALAPCWRCGGQAAHSGDDDTTSCWPPTESAMAPCTCAIERKPSVVSE